MSETIEAPATTETPAPAAPDGATEADVPGTQQEGGETTEAPETPAEPPQPPAAYRSEERRIARLTAKLADSERAREAAEALLAAQREKPPAEQLTAADIERRAEELAAQREYSRSLAGLVSDGKKEFGDAEWSARADVLRDFGAVDNPAFMQAIVNVPSGTKLIAHLADDTAALEALLAKAPMAMAAEMGRMAAKLETTSTAKAAPRQVSQAPRPPAPVTTSAAQSVDLYDPKLAADPRAFKAALEKTYGAKWGKGR